MKRSPRRRSSCRLPSTFDYAEGATFLAGHGTAYHALIDRGRLEPGEVLLVHGAGGGVGLAAVEIGKMLGATVIATASSDEKLAIAKARGADHLIRYDREPFRDAVKRITDGRGADVVFDPVGGEVFENSMRCINWGARLLIIGFTGGIGLAKTNLLMIKGASVLGVRAGEAVRKNPALGEVRIKALTEWAEAGKIRPNISHRLPLEDYAKAMRLLIDRKAIGRVALTMGDLSRRPPRRRSDQSAAFRFITDVSWILDQPPSQMMASRRFHELPSRRNAIVCAIATLFRTSHGCEVPTTTWSAMPSSLVFATDTRPSCGFGRQSPQRIDRRFPAMMPTG